MTSLSHYVRLQPLSDEDESVPATILYVVPHPKQQQRSLFSRPLSQHDAHAVVSLHLSQPPPPPPLETLLFTQCDKLRRSTVHHAALFRKALGGASRELCTIRGRNRRLQRKPDQTPSQPALDSSYTDVEEKCHVLRYFHTPQQPFLERPSRMVGSFLAWR